MQQETPFQDRTFVSLGFASTRLGVPQSWLEQQAKANAIPAIQAGRRWLIHLERTRSKLTELAEGSREVSDE